MSVKRNVSVLTVLLLVLIAAAANIPFPLFPPEVQATLTLTPQYHANYTSLIADWWKLQQAYPSWITNETYGTTVDGKAMYAYRIGNPNGGKVLMDGSCDGNEAVGSDVLILYAQWLVENNSDISNRILNNCYTIIVASANPDGFRSTRKNANGVCLYMNFPIYWDQANGSEVDPSSMWYKGPSAGSEPETQAAMALWREWNPKIYVNWHTGQVPSCPTQLLWTWNMSSADYALTNQILSEYNSTATSQGQKVYPYSSNDKEPNFQDQCYNDTGAICFCNEMIDEWPYTSPATIFPTYLGWWLPFLEVISIESEVPKVPTPVFSDGFESGSYSAWTRTYKDTKTSLTVVTNVTHTGTYASMQTINSDNAYVEANPYKTFTVNYTTLYIREYVYFPSASLALLNVTDAGVDMFGTSSFIGHQTFIGWFLVENHTGTVKWSICYRNSTDHTFDEAYAASGPSANTWYCVEGEIVVGGAGTGEQRLYVNGVQVDNITGITNNDRGNISAVWCHGGAYTPKGWVDYVDDFVCSKVYIGLETPRALQTLLTKELYENATKDIKKVFGDGMQVEFQLVEKIDRDPSGKLRKIVSKVPIDARA